MSVLENMDNGELATTSFIWFCLGVHTVIRCGILIVGLIEILDFMLSEIASKLSKSRFFHTINQQGFTSLPSNVTESVTFKDSKLCFILRGVCVLDKVTTVMTL